MVLMLIPFGQVQEMQCMNENEIIAKFVFTYMETCAKFLHTVLQQPKSRINLPLYRFVLVLEINQHQ